MGATSASDRGTLAARRSRHRAARARLQPALRRSATRAARARSSTFGGTVQPGGSRSSGHHRARGWTAARAVVWRSAHPGGVRQLRTLFRLRVQRCAPYDHQPLTTARGSRLLNGRYRLERRLGRGGMGAVYAAVDDVLERPVAVKLIRDDIVGPLDLGRRFRQEARAAAGFAHPHVVRVYDFGVDRISTAVPGHGTARGRHAAAASRLRCPAQHDREHSTSCAESALRSAPPTVRVSYTAT